MADEAPQPSFGEKVKSTLHWCATTFLAPGLALLVVIGAVLLASIGFKDLQIGGLLSKLFGKTPPGKAHLEVANSIPAGRVDKDGKLIPIGTPDSKGMTQVAVVPIEDTGGLFSNPNTVKITPPGETKPIEVALPVGVKAKDVDKVVIVQPEKLVVTVKDDSGIQATQIDDLLAKYSS